MTIDQKFMRLCSVTDVSNDCPMRCETDHAVYAVFQLDNAYYATEDACSHGPGSLSEGYIEGYEVECPFHRGRFDIRNGCPTASPCTIPIKTWEVHLVDGDICIDPNEPVQGTT